MSKLRKTLGNIHSPECIALMRLIETQHERTLIAWAVEYVKNNYLRIYETERPGDLRLSKVIGACEEYLKGSLNRNEIKPILREAGAIAREVADHPTAQAAARAISTACATINTPTNALGFLFYGAAAAAYAQAGLSQTSEVYDELASAELKKAWNALQRISIPDEPHPVKICWNC